MMVRQAPHVDLKKSRVKRNLRVTRRGRMIASNASQRTIRKMAKPTTKAPGAGIMCALYSLSWARRNGAQDSSLAETEISALKSFETGQPVSAFFTAVSNFALSAPGILAV